jgi:hypothetical protein
MVRVRLISVRIRSQRETDGGKRADREKQKSDRARQKHTEARPRWIQTETDDRDR